MTDKQVHVMALVLLATGLSPRNPPKDPEEFRRVLKRRSSIMIVCSFGFAAVCLLTNYLYGW